MAIFVIATAARLWYTLALVGEPCFQHPMTEGANYVGWATAIIGGNGGLSLPFDEGPAYPLLLAMLGGSAPRIVFVQVVLSGATAAGLAVLAAHVTDKRVVGWLAGLLAAFYGPFILHATEVGPATCLLAMLVLATLFTSAAVSSIAAGRRVLWIASASFAWLAALTLRSETIIALPFAALFVFRATRRQKLTAGLLAGPLLYIAIMTTATWVETGHPVPLTIGSGLAFWVGNHPAADGVTPFTTPAQDAEQRRLFEQAAGDATVADRLFLATALGHMRRDPAAALGRFAKKAVLAVQAHELSNTIAVDWQIRRSVLFAGWPIFPFDFGTVAALAVTAGVGSRQLRRYWPLFVGLASVGLVPTVLAQSCGRFRLPTALPVLVLAASGLHHLFAPRTGKDGWRLAGNAAAFAVVLITLHLDPFDVHDSFIPELDVNAGICDRAAGRSLEARARLERALAAHPDDAGAWRELARACAEAGDAAAARAADARARSLSDN